MGVEFVDISDSKKLTGLYIAFTQEFFDGTGPPPSFAGFFDYSGSVADLEMKIQGFIP
jgi:hypothetical protein